VQKDVPIKTVGQLSVPIMLSGPASFYSEFQARVGLVSVETLFLVGRLAGQLHFPASIH
jgi:hypothetical protein